MASFSFGSSSGFVKENKVGGKAWLPLNCSLFKSKIPYTQICSNASGSLLREVARKEANELWFSEQMFGCPILRQFVQADRVTLFFLAGFWRCVSAKVSGVCSRESFESPCQFHYGIHWRICRRAWPRNSEAKWIKRSPSTCPVVSTLARRQCRFHYCRYCCVAFWRFFRIHL